MENGSGMVDTNSLLLARGVGGGYGMGGFGGSYGGGMGSFASPSANAVRINKTDQNVENQADCTRMAMGLGMDRISDQAEEGRRSAQFTSLKDSQFQAELRNSDRLRDIEREINTNARAADKCCCDVQAAIANAACAAAKCCCDAQLEAQKNACDTQRLVSAEGASTRMLILEVEARGNADKLAECRSQLNRAEIINACHCTPS